MLQSQTTPDLLVTLAAVEAVIRAQVCHLAPDQGNQQQQQHHHQQQQQQQFVPSTTSSSDVLSGIILHPLDDAPLLLLPFVSVFLQALNSGIIGPHQQQHMQALLDGGCSSVVDKLSARLVTLLQTVLKISSCAVARAAALQDEQAGVIGTALEGACKASATIAPATLNAHKIACSLAMSNSNVITMIARCWFDSAGKRISRMQHNCDTSMVRAMQAGLLLGAMHVWARAWSSFAPAYKVPMATATSSMQGTGCSKSLTLLSQLLGEMVAAF